jgi:leader peptidase (prepilin peptidase)/N-methyltransferase
VSIWTFAATSYYLAISYPLFAWDVREHRLPNRFTISALLLTAVLVGLDALSYSEFEEALRGLIAALITWCVGYLMARFELIGMGDVKLLTGMHLLLGYQNPWLILFSLTTAFLLASALNLGRILASKLSLKSQIALGPFLLIGFFLSSAAEFTGVAGS